MKQNVKVLSFKEAIRKRPGMYFGEINSLAVNRAIYEAVANSVDQYLAGLATKVSLEIKDDLILVSDDGPGLPYEQPAPDSKFSSLAEYYLMNHHDSPTADDHAPHIHLIGGGLGLAVLNVASEYINVRSSNGSSVWSQQFGRGEILTQAISKDCQNPSGTTLEIKLDRDIFQEYKADHFDARKTLFELAHFYPGLKVCFQGETFIARKGLLDLAFIHYRNLPVAIDFSPAVRFFFHESLEGVQVQVAAIGDADKSTQYLSWVNGTSSVEGGTHVDALNNVFAAANWRPGLALIHVIMHDPRYAGPSKDALKSVEVKKVIETLLTEPIKAFQASLIK